jgi:hypothetical protein
MLQFFGSVQDICSWYRDNQIPDNLVQGMSCKPTNLVYDIYMWYTDKSNARQFSAKQCSCFTTFFPMHMYTLRGSHLTKLWKGLTLFCAVFLSCLEKWLCLSLTAHTFSLWHYIFLVICAGSIFLASSRLHSSFHSPVKFSLSYGVHATCDMYTWHIMCTMCILLYVHVQDRHVYERSISFMTHTHHATCMHVHPSHRWQRRECLAKCTSENYTCIYMSLNIKRHMIFLIRHII